MYISRVNLQFNPQQIATKGISKVFGGILCQEEDI